MIAPSYTKNLVGLGSNDASVMLGSRNSVLTGLETKQPAVISFHCNCRNAALIANQACKELPGYFFQNSPKCQRVFQ